MRRRQLLGAAAWALAGCRQLPARGDVMEALGHDVVLPSYGRLAASAARLELAARAFHAHPGEPTMRAARGAWREALAALAFLCPLRIGPIADQRLHLRAAYWPVRPAAIQALADTALDEAALGRAGVTAKGMFAIEYLLFDERAGHQGPLLVALTADLARAAREVETAARAQGLPRRLAARGREGVALLVNALVELTEAARGALDPALLERSATVRAAGARGGAVPLMVAARLQGVRAHYGGGPGLGLSALVAALAPAVDRSLEDALGRALEEVTALPARPTGSEAARATRACHTAEIALKTGVTATLGVTLTLQSADGD